MLDNINQLIIETLRILFSYGMPLFLIIALVGTIISAIQSITLINENSLGYIVKVIVLVVLFYIFGGQFVQEILNLTMMAYK